MLDRPGMRGVVMGCYPERDPVDRARGRSGVGCARRAGRAARDPRVAVAADAGRASRRTCPGYGRFFDAPNRMIELVMAGVFDRFPDLNVVFAEVDFGWVPYVKEQIDNNYHRLDPVSRFGLRQLPSEYIARALPLRVHDRLIRSCASATTWASNGSCGPTTIRTSAPTGRTRGARSKRRCRACRRTRST